MQGTPFGRYRLIELLGRGGMGEVWRAHDPEMNRAVALKLLPTSLAGDPVYRERFRREARSAASLDEPHVVPIYDFGEIDGHLYVTMRLIRGSDLQALLAHGPLEPERAVGIMEQIASALDAAHDIGLVHRDVKPSHVLIAKDDFAYLIDFGIARFASETGLTSIGITIGTWAYMAPERLNTGKADARADVYALTCVLHEALTGERPFPGDSLEQQIIGHLTSPLPRPSRMQRGVPRSLDAVIAAGMAKDPALRFATTKALARAARAALLESAESGGLRTLTQLAVPPTVRISSVGAYSPNRRSANPSKLQWSREGWFHLITGAVAPDGDQRVPTTVDEAKKSREWCLTASQANVKGGFYWRELDKNASKGGRPTYTATWHPNGGPVQTLAAKVSSNQAYQACVRHFQARQTS